MKLIRKFLGMAGGELIKIKLIDKNPKYMRKIDIETKDERNIAINNRAKAKGFDFMTKAYGILILLLALMNEGLATILLLVGVYVMVLVVYVLSFNKYSKKM